MGQTELVEATKEVIQTGSLKIAAFSAICEEDSVWITQYLKEIERLGIPFVIHLDKCSEETKHRLTSHPKCIGSTSKSDGMFSETDKQGLLNLLKELGYEWALAWDVDETWEKDFPKKLQERLTNSKKSIIFMRWANLWGDDKHIRTDGPYQSGRREKIRNLKHFDWKFRSDVVNGPYAVTVSGQQSPLVDEWMDTDCIHWGMMTDELRKFHKARWDRIYGHYMGGQNPYGFWDYSVDPNIEPVIVEYDKAQY